MFFAGLLPDSHSFAVTYQCKNCLLTRRIVSSMDASVIAQRQLRLTNKLKESGFDTLVLTPGPLLHYLTGLNLGGMERPIAAMFSVGTEPVFVLPQLEKEQLSSVKFQFECFEYGENPVEWQFSFDQAAAYCGVFDKKIGIESRQMRVFVLRHLQESAWTTKFLDATHVIDDFRSIKEPFEIDAIAKAVEVAEAALQNTLQKVQPGMTEQEIASILYRSLLDAGSSNAIPFQPIVASGPNSANPHATPSTRKIQNGDILLVDWGANVNGYCSDLTRVFAVGKVDKELTNIADVVHRANTAARTAAGPGVLASDVDKAARSVISDSGFANYFTHRTGHGFGLDVHEYPYIRNDADVELKPGMTFTIEPGIYLPGRGGVRIEDDVCITEDGCVSISTMERSLVPLGE